MKDESESEEETIVEKKTAPKKAKSVDEPKAIQMTETERKQMMEKASAELPYTFDLPDTYEELADLLKNRNAEYQNVIIERMIKSNHPKVIPENKERMNVLFAYLLQHINDVFFEPTPKSVGKAFMIIDRLCPYLYDLSHINPEQTTMSFQRVIKEKQNDFRENEKTYPDLDVLVFFKIASTLYSTSDFRHHVCTPCFLFINQILSRCTVQSRADIAKGLFLTVIVLEYTQLSKRFLPSVLNFLLGILFLSVHKRPIEIVQIIPPFKTKGAASELLVLSDSSDVKSISQQKMIATDLVQSDIDDSFKVRALNTALNLTAEFLTLMIDNVGAQLLAQPFSDMLSKLQLDEYPDFVRESASKVEKLISKIMETKLTFLTPPNQKPKVLRLMEPLFDKVYDDKRSHRPGNKDTLVHKGMIRKVKSETRGAIREIRRDNAFLSKIKLKKRMERYMLHTNHRFQISFTDNLFLFTIAVMRNVRNEFDKYFPKHRCSNRSLTHCLAKRNICNMAVAKHFELNLKLQNKQKCVHNSSVHCFSFATTFILDSAKQKIVSPYSVDVQVVKYKRIIFAVINVREKNGYVNKFKLETTIASD